MESIHFYELLGGWGRSKAKYYKIFTCESALLIFPLIPLLFSHPSSKKKKRQTKKPRYASKFSFAVIRGEITTKSALPLPQLEVRESLGEEHKFYMWKSICEVENCLSQPFLGTGLNIMRISINRGQGKKRNVKNQCQQLNCYWTRASSS